MFFSKSNMLWNSVSMSPILHFFLLLLRGVCWLLHVLHFFHRLYNIFTLNYLLTPSTISSLVYFYWNILCWFKTFFCFVMERFNAVVGWPTWYPGDIYLRLYILSCFACFAWCMFVFCNCCFLSVSKMSCIMRNMNI